MQNRNEILLYQPEETVKIEVRLENETVWLTQQQMAQLFETTKQNISLHTNNIFKEGELEKSSVVKESFTTALDGKTYRISFYNLDVIISVGYRVKSVRGTQFRIWANKILKEYLLNGYSVNQRLARIENQLDDHTKLLNEHNNKIDFFVRTSLPPVEGVFFDGQMLEPFGFINQLIRSAKKRIVLIDNYIDETVLLRLAERSQDVTATIYTQQMSPSFQFALSRHNAQYAPIDVRIFTRSHDRFLIIDETVYHIGASIKDLGKRWFAFSKMVLDAEDLLGRITT